MTPQEIQDVRAAEKADPKCLGEWHGAWGMNDDEVQARLHSRLLERECAVHQDGDEFYIIRKNWSKPVIVRTASLISCMAKAVVALAGEAWS